MIRALRITAAVGSLIACIAIGGQLVRSYSWSDSMWSGQPYSSIHTDRGTVFIRFTGNPLTNPIDFAEMWRRRSSDSLDNNKNLYSELVEEKPWWEEKSFLGFACLEEPPGGTWIHFPLWAPLGASGLLGVCLALNWMPRFSIRSVLIAMALVAAFIGAVKWRAG